MEFSHSLYDGSSEQGSPFQSMYSCADCGKLYMHKRTLKRHELVHTASSSFPCVVCGKQYSQQYDLDRHSRSHRDDKPYKCYVCGRPFAMSHHLNNHMVTHTGIRAYSCLVCSKRFAQTFSLKRHMRMHLRAAKSVAADGSISSGRSGTSADSDSGLSVGGMALLQSLSCNLCGKIFSSQQTLKRHNCQSNVTTSTCRSLPNANMAFVSRTAHRCRDCGTEFPTIRQLNEHMSLSHRDLPNKPYSCDDCAKSFAHPYSLKRHRVEHGGEAHVCAVCGKRFAQLYELSRHCRTHRVDPSLDSGRCAQPVGLASTVNKRENEETDLTVCRPSSAAAVLSEPENYRSVQVAKYMALHDAQNDLASHLMLRDRQLPKPSDICLLAFAQSLVVTSAAGGNPSPHALPVNVTATSE